jgi:hypothetical protein
LRSILYAFLYASCWTFGAILAIASLVFIVRKAKGGRGTATALMVGLLMGFGVMPQTGPTPVQEAKDSKGKKGAESGDPPFPEADG